MAIVKLSARWLVKAPAMLGHGAIITKTPDKQDDRQDIPENQINVRAVYGNILIPAGIAIPVKAVNANIAQRGNTLSIPVQTVFGVTTDNGTNVQKAVKSVYGYFLVE